MEAEKGRAAHSKAANLANSPDKVDIRSRDPSPIVASVAAIESMLDKCLKAVSKAAQAPTNKAESSKQTGQRRESNSAPATPIKYKGPNTSAAGPFKGRNGKPIRCWHCGGRGHTTRRVPYSGKLKLEGAEQGSKPSKRVCETRPEQIKREEVAKVRGEGSPPKRGRVTRVEEKKFRKIVTKTSQITILQSRPLISSDRGSE